MNEDGYNVHFDGFMKYVVKKLDSKLADSDSHTDSMISIHQSS